MSTMSSLVSWNRFWHATDLIGTNQIVDGRPFPSTGVRLWRNIAIGARHSLLPPEYLRRLASTLITNNLCQLGRSWRQRIGQPTSNEGAELI
jgi:hypothetical protein